VKRSCAGQELWAVRSILRRTGGSACFTLLFLGVSVSAQTIQQAETLWRAHDYVGATSAFDALLKAHPENADYRVRFGEFFFERYYPDEAAKLFQEAVVIDPKNAAAYLGLARVYAEDFNTEANEAADKALERNPKLYQAHEVKSLFSLVEDFSNI
jgi:cellulose synthase operon protein C